MFVDLFAEQMATPTDGAEVGSTMSESRSDPVMAALQVKRVVLWSFSRRYPTHCKWMGSICYRA